MNEHLRVRPERLVRVTDELMEHVEQERRSTVVWAVVGFLAMFAAVGALTLVFSDADSFFFFASFGLFGTVFGGIIVWGMFGKVERMELKVEFIQKLVGSLVDDLHPGKKVDLRIDLRHYDTGDKITWQGWSTHGNRKTRYTDKWLRIKCMLADHSELTIVRQAGVKIRKGELVKDKRRLFITLNPDPRRYHLGDPEHKLRGMLKAAGMVAFHDPPEDFHVNLTGEAGEFRIKVMQLDAPILPDEVVLIVREMLHYLSDRRKQSA